MPDAATTEPKPAPPPPKNPLVALYESNRLILALLALAALELVPAAGLVVSSREGWDAWATPAAGLAIAALVPPLGIALGKPWGFHAAGYVCWFGLILVILRAMTLGFTVPHLAPAAVYAAVLAALSSMTATKKPAEGTGTAAAPPPELPLAAWAKENVEAIFVAFIMALVIRCFGIEVFKIPSSSMEPTLLGDVQRDELNRLYHGGRCDFEPYHNVSRTNSGDRIMVTKFFYAFADIERYDVVVFKFPLNQSRNFIKRVVGLPDEQFMLFHGNVYAGRPGEPKEEFRITRRPLRTQDALWINPAAVRSFLDKWGTFAEYWEVDGPKPTVLGGQLSYDAAPDGDGSWVRYRSRDFPLKDPRGQDVADLRIQFELTPTGEKGELVAEISNLYGRFELKLPMSGEGALAWKGREQTKTDALRGRLEIGRRSKVELAVYDGLAYARIDGAMSKLEFIQRRKDVEPLPAEPSLRFGSRGATFELRELRVGRDVHYKPARDGVYQNDKLVRRFEEDVPHVIRPGHYVVMGDNVTSSHDSRGWVKKRYKLEGIAEPIEFEGQQEFDKGVDVDSIQARYGLPVTPSELVADKYGRIWALYTEGTTPPIPPGVPAGVIEKKLPTEDFYEIGENFIVGKALWVWWPPGRWFNLIR